MNKQLDAQDDVGASRPQDYIAALSKLDTARKRESLQNLRDMGLITLEQLQELIDQEIEQDAHPATLAIGQKPAGTSINDLADATVALNDGAPEQKNNPGSNAEQFLSSHRPPTDSQRGRPEDGNWNRYEFICEVAHGGLGRVTKAFDNNLQRDVAVKELLPDIQNSRGMVDRFLDEAIITGHLEHPNIVPVYELGFKDDGCPFYAMKILAGRTLHDSIQSFHRLSRKHVDRTMRFNKLLRAFVDVCQAIAFAHKKNVIHRDLKPRNVIIGEFGETVVVDWGLAKFVVDTEKTVCLNSKDTAVPSSSGSRKTKASNASRTQNGQILGTPSYLSPEQAAGKVDLQPASDVFALGAVLYEILVGQPAFLGNDTQTIINNVCRGAFSPPRKVNRSIPAALNAICVRAMQQRIEDRYESANELAEEVNRFLAGERVLAHQEKLVHRAARFMRKNQTMVTMFTFTCAGITAVAIAAGVMLNTARQAEKDARVEAQQAHQLEIVERNEKEKALGIAISRLADARKSADEWLLESSADLQFYPGLATIRQHWLSEAIVYYERISKSEAINLDLKAEVGLSLLRLGDARRLLGKNEKALQAYVKAKRVFSELADSIQQEADCTWTLPNARLQIANAHLGIALVALKSEPATSQEHLERAMSICQELVIKEHGNSEFLVARCRCQVAFARLHADNNRAADAQEEYRQAIEGLSYLKQEANEASHALLTSALLESGKLYYQSSKHGLAASCFRDAISAFDRLSREHSHRPDYVEGKMTCQIWLGNVLRKQNRQHEAIEAYRTGIELFHDLLQTIYRSGFHSENVAIAEVNLGQMLIAQNELEEAQRRVLEGKNEFAQLIRMHGQDPSLLRQFAVAARTLGDIYLEQDSLESASGELKTATEIFSHLSNSNVAADQDLCDLADGTLQLERVRTIRGDRETAIRNIEALATQLGRSDQESKSNSLEILSALARVRWFQAELLWQEDDSAAIETILDRLIADLENVSSWELQLQLARTLADRPDAEHRNPRKAIELLERLPSSATQNQEYWRVRAVAHLRNGNLVEAENSLRQIRQPSKSSDTAEEILWGLIDCFKGNTENAAERLKGIGTRNDDPYSERWVNEIRKHF